MKDDEIISRVRQGEADLFRLLVERYQDSILRFLYHGMGCDPDGRGTDYWLIPENAGRCHFCRDYTSVLQWIEVDSCNLFLIS